MNRSKWLVIFLLIISDVFVLVGIFQLTFYLRNALLSIFFINKVVFPEVLLPIIELGIIFLISVFSFEDLYPGYGLTAVKELTRTSKSITLVFIFLAGAAFLNKSYEGISRSYLLISWVLALIIMPISHFILRNIISRFSFYGISAAVFGNGISAQQLVNSLRQVRRLGWVPARVFTIDSIDNNREDIGNHKIAFYIPSNNFSTEKYVRILNQYYSQVIIIRDAKELGSVWVEPHDIDGTLGLRFKYNLLNKFAEILKRWFDLLLAALLLFFLSPLFGLICLVIYLDSPGPLFFYQQRLGKNSNLFNMIKFRTMVVDAEHRLHEHLDRDPAAKDEFSIFHKLSNDPRITRTGKWLRRYSLDELPQLLNVIKGDMSIAGPRAYLPSELSKMGDYSKIILKVLPGITGWWQVMGRHGISFDERVKMDEYYISNWSYWMDIYILLKTGWVILAGIGA